MSTELDRAYDVLGVKPGVSDGELKAAHRDLAKVWHPDRFVHDPRLQEKAQEKLKEINEAYEQLISRHKRRVTPPPRRSQTPSEQVRVPVKRGVGWHWWIAVPFAVFALVFAFTTKTLVREHEPRPVDSAQLEEPSEQAPTTTRPDASHTVRNRDDNNLAPAPEPATESTPTNEAVASVPTVTVSIDPESGLLAVPSCPVKSRMTYPSGSEPHGHCNINHVVKPDKKTGLKGLAKKIL
ncbi:MAG TPA: J domain-containing protein [Pyrinomonadaceae bacterium]|nr:J domain-containing protein [Pyrinomonadaceae bacterium]